MEKWRPIYEELKNSDNKILDTTLVLAEKIYHRDLDRARMSDEKTSMLLSTIGVLSGLLFFGFEDKNKCTVEICGYNISIIMTIALITMIFIIISLIFLVWSLKSVSYNVLGDDDILYIHKRDNEIEIDYKRYLASLYLFNYSKNKDVINDKITKRNYGTWSLVLAIIMVLFLFLINISV